MTKNKIIFDTEINGKTVKLEVKKPNYKEQQESQKVYNKIFRESVDNGSMLRVEAEKILKDRKIWNEDKEKRREEIDKELTKLEWQLNAGGRKLKDGYQDALKMIKLRGEKTQLLLEKTTLDNNTAEAQAENAKFNYLVSVCTVYNDMGNHVFENYDDYIDKMNEVYAVGAASRLANLLYNFNLDVYAGLPEYQWLKKYRFVDDKLRFLNKEGKLVDDSGNLVNENGFRINDKGQTIDTEGRPYNPETGEYIHDVVQPYFDEDGKPVLA